MLSPMKAIVSPPDGSGICSWTAVVESLVLDRSVDAPPHAANRAAFPLATLRAADYDRGICRTRRPCW